MSRSFPDVATSLHEAAQTVHANAKRLLEHRPGRTAPPSRTVMLDVALALHRIERDLLGLADGLSELKRDEKPFTIKPKAGDVLFFEDKIA